MFLEKHNLAFIMMYYTTLPYMDVGDIHACAKADCYCQEHSRVLPLLRK